MSTSNHPLVRLKMPQLERLRDQLRMRGQRPSIVGRAMTADVLEALEIVEQYGALCEAMYLVMQADRRVVNAEREVLKGALDVLSDGRVRTSHMESMLDAASKKVAEEGAERRLRKVIDSLRVDPAQAELTIVLAAAVAAADERIVPEEHVMLQQLWSGLGIDEARANQLLAEMDLDLDESLP